MIKEESKKKIQRTKRVTRGKTMKTEVKPKEMLNMESVEVRVIVRIKRNFFIMERVKVKPSLWDNIILKRAQVIAKIVRPTARKQKGTISKEKVIASGD